MVVIKELHKEIFADYFQFYIQDEKSNDKSTDSWTDEAIERLLALSEGIIIIGTVRNVDVPVRLKLYNEEPKILSHDDIDKINECDLEVKSNKIVLAGCTDYFPDAERIDMPNGIYRARIYYWNLKKISDDGLDGDDSYEIHLWQINVKIGIKIIKNNNASA